MVKEAVEEAKAKAQEAEEAKADAAGEAAEKEEDVPKRIQKKPLRERKKKEESEDSSGKKLFGKKNKKDKKDEKIEELTDKLTRQMAEFDNFRKRTEKEKSQMYEVGAKDVIEKILPVVDNFERGLAAVPEEEKEDPFVQGMEKVYKQLMTTLDGIGSQTHRSGGQGVQPGLPQRSDACGG